MSGQNVHADPSGETLSVVCPNSPPGNPNDIRKQRLSAIRAALHESAVRHEAQKKRRSIASAQASENILFKRFEERYGWTHSEFLQYLALPRQEQEKRLDRERKRVKAPARKNAKPKEMTSVHRQLHRAEQNRLAQQRRRANLAARKSDGTIQLSDDELALLEDLEAQEQYGLTKGSRGNHELDEELLKYLWATAAAQAKAVRIK